MLDLNLGKVKELLANFASVKDPLTFRGDRLKPGLVLEGRLDIVDVFKPDLLKLIDHIVVQERLDVRLAVRAGEVCVVKGVDRGELHNFLEAWLEIFVASRDVLVSVEASLLKHLVEALGLLHGCGSVDGVKLCEDLEVVGVDLIGTVALLRILKGITEQELAKLAVSIVEASPCFRLDGLGEAIKRHDTFAALSCLNFINSRLEGQERDSLEGCLVLPDLVLVAKSSSVRSGQVLDGASITVVRSVTANSHFQSEIDVN